MPSERYTVRVGRDHLLFSSGHFITCAGHQCERLHGHNYRAAVEVEGPLGEDWYVVDFVALTRLATVVTGELDHHMLLAAANPFIAVTADADRVRAVYGDREWVFPRGDCVLLPVENTTAELLAKYIATRLLAAFTAEGLATPAVLRVEVEEGVGVSATYEWRAA